MNKEKEFVIAHGESGHLHKLVGDFKVLEGTADTDCLLLKVLGKSSITHEEHKVVEEDILIPTTYKRRFVKQMNHIEKHVERVRD